MSHDADGLHLRAARPGDVATIVSFNLSMARETESKELDPAVLERGVAAMLADRGLGFYTLAVEQGVPVGQIMVTTEWSDWRAAPFWWIQSVYVDPDSRRKGVYTALHRHVEDAARMAGACGLRLYVERANGGAQATYRRLGMRASGYDLFETSFPVTGP